jgi:hypothetical protein
MKFLNSFEDLLIERNINLLLEGKLIGSSKFLHRIENSSNSKVGKFLYSQFSSEEEHDDLPQNVVDVTDKEDTITFMSDKSFTKLGKDPSDPEIFKAKGRSETRIGRFVRSLSTKLGQSFTDKEIEEFVNTYKAADTTKDNFKLVSGKEISKHYHQDSYAKPSGGTLGDSCMRYPECQDYFDIYDKNPDSCRMLILFDKENKVLGRALIWKISKIEMNKDCEAEYFMDRVYSCKDSDVIKFRKFAESNNWIYRKRDNNNSHFNSLVFIYKGQTVWGKIVTELRPGLKIDEFPYVDTMSFLKGKYISNVGLGQDQKILDDTEGGHGGCDSCNNTGKETIYSCIECGGNGSVQCPKCKCKKCENGHIKCEKCTNGSIDCSSCQGEGTIRCGRCDEGYNNCSKCNGEGKFDCKKCEGNGIKGKCKKCEGKAIICKICNGEERYYRKWGNGKRLVNCTECHHGWIYAGATFNSKSDSPNRCDCYVPTHNWMTLHPDLRGHNSGQEKCLDCKGVGNFNCDKCDGDGSFECTHCEGGFNSCTKCDGEGGWDCKNCNGEGRWECKDCHGDGRLDIKCKCESGDIECTACNGTGIPKNNKVECSQCVNLIKTLEREMELGFKA